MSLRGCEEEPIISQLLRASICLEKALDRCFARTGLTSQEAAVLVRCSESKDVASKLAEGTVRHLQRN